MLFVPNLVVFLRTQKNVNYENKCSKKDGNFKGRCSDTTLWKF